MPTEPPTIFKTWIERWKRAIAAARSHGVDTDDTRLEIGPPATDEQVREVEIALNLNLPPQFRQTLLEFSGRVKFSWFLRRGDNPPPPLSGIVFGGCRWDINQLVRDYEEVVWLSKNAFVEDVPEETIWKGKFPFHSIVSGDFIAIDQTSGGVVYLSHELAGSHGHWLGRDFYDFMDRWTLLGCPDDDLWDGFVPQKDRYIDLEHENTKRWCQWFGLPAPE